MKQVERSDRSRTQIMEAALRLFSTQGYRGTSIRDIAEAAGVSTGSLYHQFPDKEAVFRALLDEYWAAIGSPEFAFNQALAAGTFPDDLEALGKAARESVRKYRRHVALIYVDVVEFEGSHIRKFYSDMAKRFAAWIEAHGGADALRRKLRPGVDPVAAMMVASRFFLTYFSVEVVFGVPHHFGKDTDAVIREIADILRHGMVAQAEARAVADPALRKRAPLA